MTQKPKVHNPKVKFLLTRKFPNWEETNEDYENARNAVERRALEPEIAKIDAYAEALNVIPGHILEHFYLDELQKADTEERLSMEERAQRLNCEDSDAEADLQYWMQVEVWTGAEAAALSLGRDPRIVLKRRIIAGGNSAFKKALNQRTMLIERAQEAGRLDKLMKPTQLLNWLKAHDHSFPASFEIAISASPAHHRADLDANILSKQVAELTAVNNELTERFEKERLQADRRESLLKIIIGMAIKKYKYDPAAKYNKGFSTIMNDLELVGVELS